MISIRAHLLATLLPAFVFISAAASFGFYFSTKAELEARQDKQLAGIAVDLRFATPPGGGRDGTRNQFQEHDSKRPREDFRETPGRKTGGSMRFSEMLLTNLPSNVYCEIWAGDHEVHLKTDNLQDSSITLPAEIGDNPEFYDTVLADGTPLRAWASRLPLSRDARRPQVILAVSRLGVDETLARLGRNLVGGGLAICLLLSLLLIFTLRITLRPLQKLGEQAAAMDAESLHERFPEKSAPADIRPIVERLNSLMAKLEESFARERRFSGDLAHELRTPLAAIRTTSEVAVKWPDQASAEDFKEILQIASGLQQTLDSLLLLARMESAAEKQNPETVSSAALVEECIALHAARAAERQIQLEADLATGAALQTDPRMLRIIISNLIGNAVEYAPEGSTVFLKTTGSQTIFQCRNDAPELSAEDTAHLFERMWRKDGARTESGHAGLGLSIARACADALGLDLSAALNEHRQLYITLHS